MRRIIAWAMLVSACPASAQFAAPTRGPAPQTIATTGKGRVVSPPDVARISYKITAEGPTPDSATMALAAKADAIDAAVSALALRPRSKRNPCR